jgi:PPK2 family polyphosphate:nucleotide phosphotransferase
MLIDSPYLASPNRKIKLSDFKTDDTGPFKDKDDAQDVIAKNIEKLISLQQVLYAESKHAVLVVLQAMDTAGKDGAIKHVFSSVNPQGCSVTSFKAPSTLERAHDFLWRIHAAVPARGMIGIFNRSHYESVLVERVKELVPKDVWAGRYEQINAFEKMLADEGTTIIKFFLHISKDEQKSRLQARLDDPKKNWKFNPGDLADRKLWDQYMDAYEDVLRKCSTRDAPWFVVPADRKWFRNWVISDTLVRTLQKLHPKYPDPVDGIEKVQIK